MGYWSPLQIARSDGPSIGGQAFYQLKPKIGFRANGLQVQSNPHHPTSRQSPVWNQFRSVKNENLAGSTMDLCRLNFWHDHVCSCSQKSLQVIVPEAWPNLMKIPVVTPSLRLKCTQNCTWVPSTQCWQVYRLNFWVAVLQFTCIYMIVSILLGVTFPDY